MTDASTTDATPGSDVAPGAPRDAHVMARDLPPGREYAQALRGPWFRLWRPLVGLVAIAGGLVLLAGLMLLYALAFVVAQELGLHLPEPTFTDAWLVSPSGLLVTNLGLAVCIPLALVATWAQSGRGGLVSSVTGRLRWPLLWGAVGVAVPVMLLVGLGGDVALTQLGGTSEGYLPFTPATGWVALALVTLLTTPLQAAGEEYLFRGWISQWVGSWLSSRWLAVVLPALVSAVLFALAHGAQSPWLFADRLIFGLVASLLVWRTGGLELAIVVHAVNNLIAFLLAIAFDQLEDSLTVTEVSPAGGAVSIAGTVVTAAALLWWARRRQPVRLAVDSARSGRDALPGGGVPAERTEARP